MKNNKKYLGIIGSMYLVYSIYILLKVVILNESNKIEIFVGMNNINNRIVLISMFIMTLVISYSFFRLNKITYLIIIYCIILITIINIIYYYNRDSLIMIFLQLTALLYTISKKHIFINTKK